MSMILSRKALPSLSEEDTKQIVHFLQRIQKGHFVGRLIATETIHLLRDVIKRKQDNSDQLKSIDDFLQASTTLGRFIFKIAPLAIPAGNVVRRLIFYLKTCKEASASSTETLEGPKSLKEQLLHILDEIESELVDLSTAISQEVLDHIHKGDAILTCGRSQSVLDSFIYAKETKREFQVVVAEGAPLYTGQEFALDLMKNHIETTLISDSAIVAMMPRINLVLIGTLAVLANGGLIALVGTYNIAILAHRYGVPVCVCTGLYKVSPQYPQNKDAFASSIGPSTILDYFDKDGSELIDSVNPKYDYIPPELINLYVTNNGSHSPFYIYRLLDEYYGQVDSLNTNTDGDD